MKLTTATVMGLVLMLGLGGCTAGERFQAGPAGVVVSRPSPARSFRPPARLSARDAYSKELAVLDEEALRAWEAASRSALRSGLSIAPSFHERVRFPADAAHAIAYRFALREGQTLRIRIERPGGDGALFADMFQALRGDIFRPVFEATRGAGDVRFTATATGDYVLRLQPRIDGGLFDIFVEGNSSLLFPVDGSGPHRISGLFGDPREGGRRRHEGIDIFAPRGTPVVAVTSGRVNQARNTPVGGRVIWLADGASDLTYYFAHLDQLLVAEGSWVTAGDIIGTVGNTGNASGTAPHLHFGAYRPGTIAIDPVPLLSYTAPLAALDIDPDLLGRWTHTSAGRVRLRTSPDLAAAILAELEPATPLLVLGGVADWHRVLLADGTTGFMSARFAGDTQNER
ncbi:hypothetical protein BH23GEM9_BH23GEM9_37210 [soil metagenome]